MNVAVLSYGCSSAAGENTAALWKTLSDGHDGVKTMSVERWPVQPSFTPRAFLSARIDERDSLTAREFLRSELLHVYHEALAALDAGHRRHLNDAKIGVILASTKSFVDDFIWKPQPELSHDALSLLLKDFVNDAKINPTRTLCVSNACASSLSAIYLASEWLKAGKVTDVWVLAADRVGPFVLQGFHHLRALSSGEMRPFAQNRSGLLLGDGAAAILLSAYDNKGIRLRGAGIESEGASVTRPSQSGESLARACEQIADIRENPPQLVIAHGTATALNDPAEDEAFARVFVESSPFITATKSCIGHTLGASGAIDLIAACEILKRQQAFSIHNNANVDPAFKGRYLYKGHTYEIPAKIKSVLVTSLGFGGTNAAAMLDLV